MGKQKVVLKLSMEDAKKRSKAMKCVVGLLGVESAALDGDKITVVGEGIDCVALTSLLRKKMGYAELVTVAAVEEKKVVKVIQTEDVKSPQQFTWPSYYGGAVYYGGAAVAQPPYYAEIREPDYDENPCSIM